MKFSHGLIYQYFAYPLEVFARRIYQAGRGDIVDLPGDTAGIVMDQVFRITIEDFICASGHADTAVDVGPCLFFRQRMKIKSKRTAVNQICMRGAFKDFPEVFLTTKDDFQRCLLINGRDKEPKIGEGLQGRSSGLRR